MNLLCNHHSPAFSLLNVSIHIWHSKLITVYLSKNYCGPLQTKSSVCMCSFSDDTVS